MPRSSQSTALFTAAFIGALAGCDKQPFDALGDIPDVPAPIGAPSLEVVPYALLGQGKVAFERIGGDGRFVAVYIIDASAMRSSHILDNTSFFGPALSPDGRRIAFTKYSNGASLFDVYSVNLDGSTTQQLTSHAGQEGPPTWSPDGSQFLVPVFGDLGFYNVLSRTPAPLASDVKQLTHFALGQDGTYRCPAIIDNDVRVSVSPQGLLAFACTAGAAIGIGGYDGTAEIDVVPPTGASWVLYRAVHTDARQIPSVFSPSWSPAGDRIAFIEAMREVATSYSPVSLTVKVANADGSNVKTVASVALASTVDAGWAGLNNWSLCWMPDQSRLVFTIPDGVRTGHLWVVNVDGSGLAQITSAPGAFDRSVSCSR